MSKKDEYDFECLTKVEDMFKDFTDEELQKWFDETYKKLPYQLRTYIALVNFTDYSMLKKKYKDKESKKMMSFTEEQLAQNKKIEKNKKCCWLIKLEALQFCDEHFREEAVYARKHMETSSTPINDIRDANSNINRSLKYLKKLKLYPEYVESLEKMNIETTPSVSDYYKEISEITTSILEKATFTKHKINNGILSTLKEIYKDK